MCQINDVLYSFNQIGAVPKLGRIATVFMVASDGICYAAISDVYIAWRKGLRRVWSLPYNTHTVLLTPLSDSIPLMDEVCRRTLSFTVDPPSNNSNLVSFVSRYAVNFGRIIRQCVVM